MFFDRQSNARGPSLTAELVAQAEVSLGVRLPEAYVSLLRVQNGGVPARRCLPMARPSSWAPDHIEVSELYGIGYDDGIDGRFGSRYMVAEWGYPDIGIVVFDTPSAGHDTVMLDYRACGPTGEPRVAYVDEDRLPVVVAGSFAEFVAALVDSSCFR
jgi:hypothetical protein